MSEELASIVQDTSGEECDGDLPLKTGRSHFENARRQVIRENRPPPFGGVLRSIRVPHPPQQSSLPAR